MNEAEADNPAPPHAGAHRKGAYDVFHIDESIIFPVLALSIPIVAIVGGIVHGIIRTLGHQRMMELAQRERIAAIERGVDPSKLPPLPAASDWGGLYHPYLSSADLYRRRAHGLMIGGLVTIAVGISIAVFLHEMDKSEPAWLIGLIPAAVGVALLLGAWLVRPQGDSTPRPPQLH